MSGEKRTSFTATRWANDDGAGEVSWDTQCHEWRTIDGEECLCPIKEQSPYFEWAGTWKKEVAVAWDPEVYEVRNVDGDRHICPIKKPRVVESDIWSGREFTLHGAAGCLVGAFAVTHAQWGIFREGHVRVAGNRWYSSKGELAHELCGPPWADMEWL